MPLLSHLNLLNPDQNRCRLESTGTESRNYLLKQRKPALKKFTYFILCRSRKGMIMNRSLRHVCLTVAAASMIGGTVLGASAAAETSPGVSQNPGMTQVSQGPATPQDLAVAHQIERARTAQGFTTAAGGFNRCPAGYTCLFSALWGQGDMAWFRSGSPNLAAQHFDNRACSVWKRAPGVWKYWDEPNYRGPTWSLSSVGPDNLADRTISSLKRVS